MIEPKGSSTQIFDAGERQYVGDIGARDEVTGPQSAIQENATVEGGLLRDAADFFSSERDL